MDIRNKKAIQLTSGTRYMSASISPDAKLIAATENGVDNSNALVFLDTGTGKVIDKIASRGMPLFRNLSGIRRAEGSL